MINVLKAKQLVQSSQETLHPKEIENLYYRKNKLFYYMTLSLAQNKFHSNECVV